MLAKNVLSRPKVCSLRICFYTKSSVLMYISTIPTYIYKCSFYAKSMFSESVYMYYSKLYINAFRTSQHYCGSL